MDSKDEIRFRIRRIRDLLERLEKQLLNYRSFDPDVLESISKKIELIYENLYKLIVKFLKMKNIEVDYFNIYEVFSKILSREEIDSIKRLREIRNIEVHEYNENLVLLHANYVIKIKDLILKILKKIEDETFGEKRT